MSVIDADYAEQLGLKAQGGIRGHGFGEQFALSFVEVSGYRVGEVSFASQKIYVSQGLTARSYEPEVAGILGYDFLSRFVVEIDYAAQSIRLHDPDGFSYSGDGQVIAAPLKYRTFQLPVSIADVAGQWSLDLGSHRSSLLYPFAEQHDLLNRPGVETVSQGLAGLAFERVAMFNELKIGKFRLQDMLLSIPAEKGAGAAALGEISGYLGNTTLRHFKLILDYPRQQVILEPGRDFARRFARDGSGMLIGLSEQDQPMISFVANQTPAEAAGFTPGDLIEQVNGQPVAEFGGVVPLRKLLRQQPGTRHRFIVRRGEARLALAIELQDLHPPRSPVTVESPDPLSSTGEKYSF